MKKNIKNCSKQYWFVEAFGVLLIVAGVMTFATFIFSLLPKI